MTRDAKKYPTIRGDKAIQREKGKRTVLELLLLVGEFFISLTNSRFHSTVIRIGLKCLKVKFDSRVLKLFGFEDKVLCDNDRVGSAEGQTDPS